MLAWIISSGVSVVSVLLIRRIFKGKISLRLQYALWLLVLVRLLIPVNIIDTDLSILNFLTQAQAVGGISDLGGAAGGSARSSQDAFMQNLLKRGTMGGISETMPYERLAEGKTGQQSDESLIWSEEALLGRDISSLRPDIPEVQDDKAAGMGLWEKILIGIWILGMAVSAAVIAGVNLGFAHRLRRARKAADIREIEFFRADNGLPVYIVPGLPGPCLFGLLHPAIYLPEGIKQDQLPYVLAHEESHYRLGDHVWSLLRSICLALHWYHPLVWLAVYVSCQDSELACDERVVRQLGEESRSAYGRVLLDMTVGQGHKADFLCFATTMTADGRSLKERIQMIAFRPRTRAVTGVAVAALMLGIFCVACTGVKGDVDSDAASGSGQESGEIGKTVPEQDVTGGGETGQHTADPTVDHVRSDNVYYRVIQDTTIDDPYFTMKVPEGFVGQVAYGVVLGKNQAGESYLQHMTLFHIPSISQLWEGDPQYGWHEMTDGGCLCYCYWTGLPDLEPDLEEIAFRSGSWDIREMEYILAKDYDEYAGVGGSLAQANKAGTGAYFWMEPTDVQYDLQNPEGYEACLRELAECWNSFTAKSFPYEELEEYSGEIPRWRQDFEEAEVVYSWFTSMGEVPMKALTDSDMGSRPYMDASGVIYGRVDLPDVNTMEDLRNYVNRYFAPEITDSLLSGKKPELDYKGAPPFLEEDGVLYGMSGGVGQYHRTDARRQYAVRFTEVTGAGLERAVRMPEENGQKYRAYVSMICQCSWSMLSDDVLPTAVLDYVMERQEDGSWRMVEDYELPVSLTLKEDSKYGLYLTMVGEIPCLLSLDRDGTFGFCEAASSVLTDGMRGRFEWSDEMLVLKFVDSDIEWYLQMQDGGRWNLTFREDLSTQLGNVLLPDGIVFERVS